ncbi:MAG: preprotein translocase subunit YajC [Clostridia bacterium]
MFFNNILAAEAASGASSWLMIGLMLVVVVGFMLLSIIPNKKRQKKQQEMMNNITVGTKIKTIGGFVGVIKVVDNQNNSFVIDLSVNEDGSMLATIDRSSVYTVLSPLAPQGDTTTEAAPAVETVAAADDKDVDAAIAEKKAEKEAEKKAKAQAKKEVAKKDVETENAQPAEAKVEENK